jgi:hypothetical protein
MEYRLAGETEVLGENLPQRHFCPSQNLTRPDPGDPPPLNFVTRSKTWVLNKRGKNCSLGLRALEIGLYGAAA